MTDALVVSPTHDAEIAAMLARTEETLGSLVVLNDAVACLAKMVCNIAEIDKITAPEIGCLISLCGKQLDQVTGAMWSQLDKDQRIQAAKIKPTNIKK